MRELITDKEKYLCRIGIERPYGTVCEHVRSADGPYLSISLFHCRVIGRLERKNKASFFTPEPFRSPLINQPAIHINKPRWLTAKAMRFYCFSFTKARHHIAIRTRRCGTTFTNIIRMAVMAPPICQPTWEVACNEAVQLEWRNQLNTCLAPDRGQASRDLARPRAPI